MSKLKDVVEAQNERSGIDEGIIDTVRQSKTLNKKNYSAAAKMLAKRIKKDPKTDKKTHAFDVAKIHRNVHHRKLSSMVAGDWRQGDPILESLTPDMGVAKYIEEFSVSEASHFESTTASGRRQMAVATYIADRQSVSEGAAKPESVKFNPVAKNMNKFNKSSVQKDRKKAFKRGDTKHKEKY